MKKFLSIERNFRGFTYTREFNTEAGFTRAMVFQRDNENDEVEWAKLINMETGANTTEYSRGMTLL